MEQHVLSRWLLASFGRAEGGRRVLSVYDKEAGSFSDADAERFLAEHDAHSAAVETALAQLETPAAAAALRLQKRVRGLAPGLYAVVPEGMEVRESGPQVTDKGVAHGMRLLVSERVVPSPTQADRLALTRYAGAMYQRAPGTEAAILQWGVDFTDAAQRAVEKRVGMTPAIPTGLEHRRARIPAVAEKIAASLTNANWWVVRAGPGESFVLSDSPVAATPSLGHDGEGWVPILASHSYVVVMPLGPVVALLFAPQKIMPITGTAIDLPGAINRLMWRSANQFVLARTQTALETAWPQASEAQRRQSVRPARDQAGATMRAEQTADRILLEVSLRTFIERKWPSWSGCRLDFGPGNPDADDGFSARTG